MVSSTTWIWRLTALLGNLLFLFENAYVRVGRVKLRVLVHRANVSKKRIAQQALGREVCPILALFQESMASKVSPQMTAVIPDLSKFLVAKTAFIWLVARVHTVVDLQLAVVSEALVACDAREL